MNIQSAIGASLWQCQALEESLIHIILIGIKLDRDADPKAVDELFNKYGELTMGQLVSQIQNISDVPTEVKKRLKTLKNERNWLAHKSWSDTLPHSNALMPTKLSAYFIRIIRIGDEALELNKMLSEVMDERVQKAGVTKEYIDIKTKEIYSRWLAG